MQLNNKNPSYKEKPPKRYCLVYCLIAVLILIFVGIFVHHNTLDGLDGLFLRLLFFERNTVFAQGYSDKAFKKIKIGMSSSEVISLVGSPLRQLQWYAANPEGEIDRFFMGVRFVEGVVQNFWLKNEKLNALTEFAPDFSLDKLKKVRIGMHIREVHRVLGEPLGETFVYSKTPNDSSYRVRVVIIEKGFVTKRFAHFYVD